MVRGAIHLMELAPRSGSEQAGRRPGIIVSHNAFSSNPGWRSVTIVPLTTAERWLRPSPTTVPFAAGEGGLPKACAALAHQVTTLDKSKVIGPALGHVPAARMSELERALANYFQLP